jgi:phage shock protein PspC (stress-responsive transcriptional regulator)
MDPVLVRVAAVRSILYYGAVYGIVLAVAVWIYRDAKARGSNRALAWFVATLLFTILPVLLYLYLHRDIGPASAE